jgi:GDPmannose 4,6-dehydratase
VARALITGITGQDGAYLANELHTRGVEVWGTSRRDTVPDELPFANVISIPETAHPARLSQVLATAQPDEIYHLAAQSSVTASWDDPLATAEVTGVGTLRLLETVREIAPSARTFIASSSEIFGDPERAPQDEQTPIRPVSPYGAAKAFAHHLAAIYRRRYGLFVAVGILYNHESPRRPASFVSQKIVAGAVAIAQGRERELRMGNLEARRDWGFAGDYVRAMRLMLCQPAPDDYIIATGETHTVREFCELAFASLGLDYRGYVVSDPHFWRPASAVPLVGEPGKARRQLGWAATTSFADLVQMMVEAELARVG